MCDVITKKKSRVKMKYFLDFRKDLDSFWIYSLLLYYDMEETIYEDDYDAIFIENEYICREPTSKKEKLSRFFTISDFTPDHYAEIKKELEDSGAIQIEPTYRGWGKILHQRRNICFFSDESIGYRYSNQIIKSTPLEKCPTAKHLLELVNLSLGTNFNGVLVNIYVDGTKYISPHSDEEKALDPETNMVAGICYGPGVRTFRIRKISEDKNKKGEIILDLDHEPCTLIVMEGDFQKHYTHEIPPLLKTEMLDQRRNSERISLTFRHHTE